MYSKFAIYRGEVIVRKLRLYVECKMFMDAATEDCVTEWIDVFYMQDDSKIWMPRAVMESYPAQGDKPSSFTWWEHTEDAICGIMQDQGLFRPIAEDTDPMDR